MSTNTSWTSKLPKQTNCRNSWSSLLSSYIKQFQDSVPLTPSQLWRSLIYWSLVVYFNDRHFSVSMSDFKWSHRNAPCWTDKGSEFNSPTNKPAALTTRLHMIQYHTSTQLRLKGPITCVIKDHCLSCLLTWTFPIKEWPSKLPTPV